MADPPAELTGDLKDVKKELQEVKQLLKDTSISPEEKVRLLKKEENLQEKENLLLKKEVLLLQAAQGAAAAGGQPNSMAITVHKGRAHDKFTLDNPTLEVVKQHIEGKWPELVYTAYEVVMNEQEVTTEEAWVQRLLQTIKKKVFTLKLTVSVKSKGHSDFKGSDGFEYMGLDASYEPAIEDDQFEPVTFDEDKEVPGMPGLTIGSLLDKTATWLFLLGHAYKSITFQNCEYTRREFLSPFLVAAILIVGRGVYMRAELDVDGLHSHGKVDYVAIYMFYQMLLSEAKKEKLEDGVPQVCAEMASARYVAIRKLEGTTSQGTKRKMDDLDKVLKITTTALLTNGADFVLYRYIPAADGTPRRLVRSAEFSANISPGKATEDTLKMDVRQVVGRLVAALQFQMNEVDANIPNAKVARLDVGKSE